MLHMQYITEYFQRINFPLVFGMFLVTHMGKKLAHVSNRLAMTDQPTHSQNVQQERTASAGKMTGSCNSSRSHHHIYLDAGIAAQEE